MTESAIDPAAAPARDPVVPILFAVAIFTSAALVFVVQPMVAKLVLPMLGGSPSVWNTSMVFFQTALLAGYAYAHVLQRVRTIRLQLAVHLALLLLAALFLPLKINGLLGDPDPNAPIGWLLRPWPCRSGRRSRCCRPPRRCCRPGTPGSAPVMPTARTPMSSTRPRTSAAFSPCWPIRWSSSR